jgi:hypothetical protein
MCLYSQLCKKLKYIQVKSSPSKNVRPYPKTNQSEKGWGHGLSDNLLSKSKVLSSKPQYCQNKIKLFRKHWVLLFYLHYLNYHNKCINALNYSKDGKTES